MAAKLTRLTHQLAIQLLLAAESSTVCSSRSRWAVWKLLDTPSYRHCSQSGGLSVVQEEPETMGTCSELPLAIKFSFIDSSVCATCPVLITSLICVSY